MEPVFGFSRAVVSGRNVHVAGTAPIPKQGDPPDGAYDQMHLCLEIVGEALERAGTGFQDDHNVNATIATLDGSLSSLRTQSAKFGSTLTTVQARQDFTKNLIGTLQTGADNLVLADSNEEGANLLALNTRQSLSTTALSLANQSSQAVLRLLG